MEEETMSDTHDNGGPAFPRTGFLSTMETPQGLIAQYENKPEAGMTLRDWFAGQAIGFIAMQPVGAKNLTYASTARDAYAYADAMLAARKEGK
jgi:hypothetical protein